MSQGTNAMHLSLLGDGYLSDSVADVPDFSCERTFGQMHRDGVVRGLLFGFALAVPLLAAAMATHVEASGLPAPSGAAQSSPASAR